MKFIRIIVITKLKTIKIGLISD